MAPAAVSTPGSPKQKPSAPDALCPPHMQENLNVPISGLDYVAHTQAMPSNFRAMMNSGSLVLGASIRYPSVDAARVIATLPHHFCFVDIEHMAADALTMTHIIRTINWCSKGRMSAVVRVPKYAPHLIAYALNAGAGGIVMPHVQNAEQARQLVEHCRFPPLGHRGHPPATVFGDERKPGNGKTVFDIWDENICVIAQIEDAEGVKNIEEITAVEGVDTVMVGTHDLRLELGLQPRVTFDGDEPVFIDALEKITRAVENKGPNGMAILGLSHMGPDMARRVARGWRAFIITLDASLVHEHGKAEFEKANLIVKQATGQLEDVADGDSIEALKQKALLHLSGGGQESMQFA